MLRCGHVRFCLWGIRMGTQVSTGGWLYFAYGGNMNPEQLRARCPGAEVVAIACFPDHKIGFFGHSKVWDGALATFIPIAGAALWGVVYKLTRSDGDCLDAWQGVRFDGSGPYFHYPAIVIDGGGNFYDVLLYKKDVLGAE